MTDTLNRSISHAQFTVERHVPVSPPEAFAAFATLGEKQKWFGGGDGWEVAERSLDFRVGGLEVDEGVFHGEQRSRFEATYTDIVDDNRIVYTYDMWVNGTHISTSVATWEFEAHDDGTTITLVEFGAHLDGFDTGAMREEGTREIVQALVDHLS